MSAISYTAQTPLSFLERSARVWPGKVAVVYGSRRPTYAVRLALPVPQQD
jgi:fatty-acyl-CoA synthase